MTQVLNHRQFSVHEYALMRDMHILAEDERIELLDGEIYIMSPIGPFHVGIVNKLNRLLITQIGPLGIVSVQNPVQLNDYSEPQPDLAILSPREDYYVEALARPEDILLIIEIADSSIDYDRNEKLPRYAQAHISEVWIVDVSRQIIEQYSEPLQDEYRQLRKVLPGEVIAATLVPIRLNTSDLF